MNETSETMQEINNLADPADDIQSRPAEDIQFRSSDDTQSRSAQSHAVTSLQQSYLTPCVSHLVFYFLTSGFDTSR